MMRISRCLVAALVVSAAVSARATSDTQETANALRERTGASARLDGAVAFSLPEGVVLDDGLTRDEAVAVALWNNAEFQVAAAGLGFARADLLEAGLITNPVLSLLFPVGPKQLEATLRLPIEILWERPRRIAAARAAGDVVAQRLIQTGLDLAAATKEAHTDLSLAQERARLAAETSTLVQRISNLTATRLAAGDIGELEARAARVDSARAMEDASRTRHDITIAAERLRRRIGLPREVSMPALVVTPGDLDPCGASESLLTEALAARPDVRAAELAIEAAARKLGWERSRVLAITALIDANGKGSQGREIGPGIDVGLPLFNRNQVGKARAAVEIQQATAAYAAARQRAALEVMEASVQYGQAAESQSAWRATVVEPLEANVAAAERSFGNGETSFLFVLENTRRLAEARGRAGELDADLKRARARIERAVGRNCR